MFKGRRLPRIGLGLCRAHDVDVLTQDRRQQVDDREKQIQSVYNQQERALAGGLPHRASPQLTELGPSIRQTGGHATREVEEREQLRVNRRQEFLTAPIAGSSLKKIGDHRPVGVAACAPQEFEQ
jgi:hypothetical protein